MTRHRLEHQVSDESGTDLVRTRLPEDHRQTHATKQHRPDEQFPAWLILAVFCFAYITRTKVQPLLRKLASFRIYVLSCKKPEKCVSI